MLTQIAEITVKQKGADGTLRLAGKLVITRPNAGSDIHVETKATDSQYDPNAGPMVVSMHELKSAIQSITHNRA